MTFMDDATGWWDAVSEGDVLPEIELAISYARVIAIPAATWDYFPGHHDPFYAKDTTAAFEELCFSKPYYLLNVEYKNGNIDVVTLYAEEGHAKHDIGKTLIANGYAVVEMRREARLQPLVNEYLEAEKAARSSRKNIWRYGDFTGNDI